MPAREALAIQRPHHFIAQNFKDNSLPLAQRNWRLQLPERHGSVRASVVVVIFLNSHSRWIQHDAAHIVFGIRGSDAEPAGLAAVERDVVQPDLASDHNVLKVEADRSRRRMLVIGVFGSTKRAIHKVPMAAALFDIKPPTFKAAGEPRDTALGWR